MNLDEYIKKVETGAFDSKKLKLISRNQLRSRILRLYGSYGEAKKTGFYGKDSLRWILSCLEEALKLAGFARASSLLKTDINASFSSFWNKLEECNNQA